MTIPTENATDAEILVYAQQGGTPADGDMKTVALKPTSIRDDLTTPCATVRFEGSFAKEVVRRF